MDTKGGQDLCGDALLVLEQGQQELLDVDELRLHLLRLVGRNFEDLLGPGSEGDLADRHRAARGCHVILDGLLHRLEVETEIGQNRNGLALALLDDAEEQVLGADVVVP